jgi:hypothetical protein
MSGPADGIVQALRDFSATHTAGKRTFQGQQEMRNAYVDLVKRLQVGNMGV